MWCHLQISSYRIDLMTVNGPISPKQCYYEMDYSFYSFYWLDSLEIRLDHNSTYYRSLSKNSDVKPRISHCDSQNLQYKTHPEFWPSQRRIFKTSLYYKTRLILETRRYVLQASDLRIDMMCLCLSITVENFNEINSLRLSDAYMCHNLKHHWFR